MTRWTKISDREQIRALWETRFSDSASFVDWFFRERFSPAHSAVFEENGQVICSIQGWPCHTRIRDAIVPCCIVAGVSTLPAYERRGYMRRTMEFYMNGIGERGGTLVTYRPENAAVYEGFGHCPCTRAIRFQADPLPFRDDAGAVPLDPARDLSHMLLCYTLAARHYSGIVCRSAADMRLKTADYQADGGRFIGIWKDGALTGYCAFFDTDDGLWAEELVSLFPAAERELVQSLQNMAIKSGKPLRGKLPPDSALPETLRGVTAELRPMNLMGVGDVRALLRAVGHDRAYRVAVTDKVVAANNGVFDFRGFPTDGQPQMRISAGHLIQFLCGYVSLLELCANGLAEAADPAVIRALDEEYPAGCCYIVDEY